MITIVLVAIVITSAFYFVDRFDIKNDEDISKKLTEQSQEDFEDMNTKANVLMDIHNEIVNDLGNRLSDPLGFGFDVDSGWSNIESKRDWCAEFQSFAAKDQLFLNKLENALNNLENTLHKTPKLIEDIEKDYELLEQLQSQVALEDKMLYGFSCHTDDLR